MGQPRREGHPRPDRDLAGRLPRHGRGRGDHHRPWRGHLPRGGRRAPDRQAVRGRLGRPDRRLRQLRRRTATSPGPSSRRATGSASTGRRGALYVGALPTVDARFEDQPELQKILGWADDIRRMEVWTNADKPEEAAQARRYGAQGIGLCRTEHMFREGERLEIVRGAILVANAATRAKAKRAAGTEARPPTRPRRSRPSTPPWPSSRCSSRATSRASSRRWTACPSSIRLIDPPLHEFLPNLEEQLVKVTKAGDAATEEDKELLATIKSMHEQNPMLGLRGCRLGPDDPGLREGPDPGHPERPDRGQEGRRQPEGQDHDPARRARERAVGDQGAAREARRRPSRRRPASRSSTSSAR